MMLDREQMLCFSLGVAMRRISKLYADSLVGHGITPPQLFLLRSLQRGDGRKPCELAGEVCLDASSLTGLLDRTEKAGFIERQKDPSDRRALRIFLTKTGRTRLVELEPLVKKIQKQIDQELFEGRSEEDIALFRQMLEQVGEVLQ